LYVSNLNNNFFKHFLALEIYVVFACVIVQFWVNVIHLDLSTNISRSYHILFKMEYFIDKKNIFDFDFIAHQCSHLYCISCSNWYITGARLYNIYGIFKIARYENRCKNNYNNIKCKLKFIFILNNILKKFVCQYY